MAFSRNNVPFGVLLKTTRQRHRLTQQRLAEALGVHRRTLIRWEQGEMLPDSKAMVLELARSLKLDDQETRQLLEASLTALTPHWSVPLPRNPFFTGREEILEALHRQLGIDQVVALMHSSALHGLGGIGKTQIALEYVYRHALEYSAVFWIGAETDEQIIASLLHIAEVLQLPEYEDKDEQRTVAAVQRWLGSHGQWLLIWDNLEDLALLDRFLPTTRSGAILLTTRNQTLDTFARGLDLLPMEQEEGILFLLRRAKMLPSEATREQVRQLATQVPARYAPASALVTVLGGLPLALDQAGAYLEETQCGLPAYLDLFHTRRAALLQRRGDGARDHLASVSTTFLLAITTTSERHPAIRDLLQVCAFLQADAIPEELFCHGGTHLGPQLQAVGSDPFEWDRAVSLACSYALVSRQPEEQTLSMHRLVQVVLLDTMTEMEREQQRRRIIRSLDAVFPEVQTATKPEVWKQCERLLPHALLAMSLERETTDPLVYASLDHKIASYLVQRGQYAKAEPFYQRALHLREQALGSDHPDVASSLNYLGVLYFEQGKYAAVEPLYLRALEIREQVLGLDHLDVAYSLNNLANLYWTRQRYEEAESLYVRALEIGEHLQGPDHPDVARSLDNLAMVYCMQGKYTEAEPIRLRALHIREQSQGPHHPDVARTLNNLVAVYFEQGRYGEAEPLCVRALQIREQVQGPDHPEVAFSLINLAELYRAQSKNAEAEPLYLRALQISEQALSIDHPIVAHPLKGLADLYREQSRYQEAEILYKRALSIREHQLGLQHSETAETLHDLALLRQKQGNLAEARICAEHALHIRVQVLGDIHPHTVVTRDLYAHLMQEQGNEAIFEQFPESIPCPRENKHTEDEALPPSHKKGTPTPQDSPLRAFLEACCEFHPHAWCRSSDLWQAYQQWGEKQQERYSLSRGAFIAQLKAHGCRADRTKTTRIWRGIALAKLPRVTADDASHIAE